MNEISKLYENAGVKSFKTCEFCTQKSVDCLKGNISNKTCGLSSEDYPFTAEKQIELIIFFVNSKGQMIFRNIPTSLTVENFGDKLALTINRIWQDLTEEEKQQIKEILE